MAAAGNSIAVKHSEFLATWEFTALAKSLGRPQSKRVCLTPGWEDFEWVNRMASQYTFYRWRRLQFRLKPRTRSIAPTAYSDSDILSRGTISAFIDYDAANATNYVQNSTANPSKNDILDSAGSKETSVGRAMTIRASTNPYVTNNDELLFCPDDSALISSRSSSFGTFFVRYDGPDLLPGASTDKVVELYDIWCDYEIEFYKPRQLRHLSESNTVLRGHFNDDVTDTYLMAPSASHSLGEKDLLTAFDNTKTYTTVCKPGAAVGLESSDGNHNRIVFTPKPDHIYKISYRIQGSSLGAVAQIAPLAVGDGFENVSIPGDGTYDSIAVYTTTENYYEMHVKALREKTPNVVNVGGNKCYLQSGDYWVDIYTVNSLGTPTITNGEIEIIDLGKSSDNLNA
jgi:hypothetical protein